MSAPTSNKSQSEPAVTFLEIRGVGITPKFIQRMLRELRRGAAINNRYDDRAVCSFYKKSGSQRETMERFNMPTQSALHVILKRNHIPNFRTRNKQARKRGAR